MKGAVRGVRGDVSWGGWRGGLASKEGRLMDTVVSPSGSGEAGELSKAVLVDQGEHWRGPGDEGRQGGGHSAEEGVVGRWEEVNDESGTVDHGAFGSLEVAESGLKQKDMARGWGCRGTKIRGVRWRVSS
jgi:hypothetical protein